MLPQMPAGPEQAPMDPSALPPELLAILQDPMAMAVLQRMMASGQGLPGLPPPRERAPQGSPASVGDPDAGEEGAEEAAEPGEGPMRPGGGMVPGGRPHGGPSAMMEAAKKRAASKSGRNPPPRAGKR
jgi:hypothetical protein